MFEANFEGSFDDKRSVESNFCLDEGELNDCTILYANYDCHAYDGYAFVLFERDGKLYEVHGSHCSCYGLEGQWEPEETTVEELQHRIDNGNLGEAMTVDALRNLIEYLAMERKMRELKITTKLEFTEEDVKELIADYVRRTFKLEGDVTLNVGIEYADYGYDKSGTTVFKSAVFTSERSTKG